MGRAKVPELPDVEALRLRAAAGATNRTIVKVAVESPSLLACVTSSELRRALTGGRFSQVHRHGKYLFLEHERKVLLVLHFGMTGGLEITSAPPPPYTRLLVEFDDGSRMAYTSRRKLGRIALAESRADFIAAHRLGIDALDRRLTAQHLATLAGDRNAAVKCWLMDQETIAGIGNVYSDEILFQAHIHPRKPARDLSAPEIGRLHRALREVLRCACAANARSAALPTQFLLPHRKRGEACPQGCGVVERIELCSRSGYYCPACQRL